MTIVQYVFPSTFLPISTIPETTDGHIRPSKRKKEKFGLCLELPVFTYIIFCFLLDKFAMPKGKHSPMRQKTSEKVRECHKSVKDQKKGEKQEETE